MITHIIFCLNIPSQTDLVVEINVKGNAKIFFVVVFDLIEDWSLHIILWFMLTKNRNELNEKKMQILL